MQQRVGTCSLCGGNVVGERGPWGPFLPSALDTCAACGATWEDDVLPMTSAGTVILPRVPRQPPRGAEEVADGRRP